MEAPITDYATAFERIILDKEDYPVDFDDAWQQIGYAQKKNALEMLEKNFEEGEGFFRFGEKTPGEEGGRPSKDIRLTIDCFKMFCMLAQTERGKLVRRYFVECEKRLHKLMLESYQREQAPPVDRMQTYRRLVELKKLLTDTALEIRVLEKQMGTPSSVNTDYFMDWAEKFFTKDRLDVELQRHFLQTECRMAIDVSLTPQKFRLLIQDWCHLHGYTLNPPSLLNLKTGTIVRKRHKLVQVQDGSWHSTRELGAVECFYVQTRALLPQPILFN